MEPIYGLILILVIASLSALIAAKKRRSALLLFALSAGPVLPMVILASYASGGNGVMMGWAAFFFPVLTLVASVFMDNGEELAAKGGAHGEHVRCPYCAEPVRRQAIRCRHCASDLAPGSVLATE